LEAPHGLAILLGLVTARRCGEQLWQRGVTI
jgi:hypothetical protein